MVSYHCGPILRAYDFRSFHTIIDIGGGNGTLLFAILHHTPGVRGIIFDDPLITGHTDHLIHEQQLQDRCFTIPGDSFESIPGGGDAYLIRYLLHDWESEDALRILHNCARAMRPGSRLLVFDTLRDRDHDESAFRTFFHKAALRLNRIIPLDIPELSIIEVVKT